ncbi:MAG TPA: PAS domain S-box protein, partial [Rhodothermales bacterium]|nr:PAS domain S-box protein [Rhodothermales bacterium]
MESNRLREQLLNAVGQALIATDLDGRITYWNQAAERLYGWAADEVLGRNILDVTPTKISREQATEIMEFLRAGKSWTGEFIVSHRDGTSFPVEVTDTPIMDDNGAMIGMIGLSTDITERRWAEAVLQENETRLRSVVESLPTALVMVDESGTITLVNKQVERWFGYNREELIGQPVDRLVPEPVRDQHQAERDDYLRAPTARKMGVGRDLYARRKDGSTFPVEIGLTPIEMVDGSRILATIVDITERKQAEEELRESESRYRLVIEAGRMGTWEWDVQAGKLHWSDYMRELFGVEPGQFDGRLETVRAWIHPEDRPLARSELQRVLAGGGEYHLEFRVLRPDGTIRWLNSHGRVRYDEEGKPQHVAGIVMDITD